MAAGEPPLRLALCGLGVVAQVVYLPLLARRRDLFRLVAVCDVAPEATDAVGEAFGVPADRRMTSVAAVAALDDVDAVLLLTSGSHGDDARALLAAGKAVLCEKPLAYTRAEAEALKGSERLHLGYMKQLDPAVEAAADAVTELGALRAVDVTVLHPSLQRQLAHLGDGVRSWADTGRTAATRRGRVEELRRQALGPAADRFGWCYTDVLLGSVVHELSVLRTVTGELTTVERAVDWGSAGTRSLAVAGWTDRGAHVDIGWHLLPEHPTYREQVRVHGERGSVSLEFPSPYLLHAPTQLTVTTAEGAGHRQLQRTSYAEAFERQLERFAGVARGTAYPPSGAEEGLGDIIICQRIAAALCARHGVTVGGEAAL